MNKHMVQGLIMVAVLAGLGTAASSTHEHAASCVSTAPTAQSQCLPGLTPLAHGTPDITVAPCTMAHVPAYTRTDICIDAAGTVVPRP